MTNAISSSRKDPSDRFTGPEFLRRTSWAVLISGAAVALGVTYKWGSAAGLGFLIGTVWGLGNFWGLAWLLRALAHPTSPDKAQALRAGLFKLALYTVGILLLFWNKFPVLALVSGFTWLLAVLVLRAGGAMLVLKDLERNKTH